MTNTIHTPRQLAQVLRGRRTVMGVTQQAVGAPVGLLPKTIHALESTPERCSVASLFKLLSALELEIVLRPKTSGTKRPTGTEW